MPLRIGKRLKEVRPSVEHQFASIVLVGRLNPAIFTPAWLAKNDLITDAAMEAANVNIVHKEVTQFSTGGFAFDINSRRFSVRSSDEPFVKLLDLVVGMFGEFLVHTPIEKLGINSEIVYACRSAKQRMEFGRKLAPLAPWGEYGKRMSDGKGVLAGGVVTMTMQENPNDGREAGYRRVEVEPFSEPSQARVKVSINDHYELAEPEKADGALKIVSILQDNFERSLAESRRIVDELIDYSSGLPE